MRVIIRFSLNRDAGSVLGTALANVLHAEGIDRTDSTSTYEGQVTEQAIERALAGFWGAVSQNKTNATVDHFWMYTDRTNPASVLTMTPKISD